MSRNVRTIKATPKEVWAVLADGWLYPSWVVGASRMRAVDDRWPEADTMLHHSVGVWPSLINDSTSVVESIPEQLLSLRARGWPAGEADVVIRLAPVGTQTEVSIEEDVARGVGKFVPGPLRHLLIGWRNTETLRRLAFLAEGR